MAAASSRLGEEGECTWLGEEGECTWLGENPLLHMEGSSKNRWLEEKNPTQASHGGQQLAPLVGGEETQPSHQRKKLSSQHREPEKKEAAGRRGSEIFSSRNSLSKTAETQPIYSQRREHQPHRSREMIRPSSNRRGVAASGSNPRHTKEDERDMGAGGKDELQRGKRGSEQGFHPTSRGEEGGRADERDEAVRTKGRGRGRGRIDGTPCNI